MAPPFLKALNTIIYPVQALLLLSVDHLLNYLREIKFCESTVCIYHVISVLSGTKITFNIKITSFWQDSLLIKNSLMFLQLLKTSSNGLTEGVGTKERRNSSTDSGAGVNTVLLGLATADFFPNIEIGSMGGRMDLFLFPHHPGDGGSRGRNILPKKGCPRWLENLHWVFFLFGVVEGNLCLDVCVIKPNFLFCWAWFSDGGSIGG